ncbi:MAG: pyrimidine dimer DNA glycosylase/endonuclease V [archaeon]
MVRINLIDPAALSDQHLIAEYDELLMLLGYVRRYPEKKDIPEFYTLGKGHMKFFKDKLHYLRDRHELLKKEMRTRGFRASITISLSEFPRELHGSYVPTSEAIGIIKQRITQKLLQKPSYYRYYGEYRELKFFLGLIEGIRF